MNDEEKMPLAPLEPDIATLLAAERPLVAAAPERRLRALRAVESMILAGGSGGAEGGGSGAGEAAPGTAAAQAGAVANPAGVAPAIEAKATGLLLVGGKAAAVIGATFLAGVIAGGVGVSSWMKYEAKGRWSGGPVTSQGSTPSRVTPPLDPMAVKSAASTEVTTISIDDLPDAAMRTARVPLQEGPLTTPGTSNNTNANGLGAERALLDVARSALGRGAPDEALEAATRHGREYPQGLLAEEREALAIRALVAVGQRDQALARAQRFRVRYPKSLLLPAVDGAVGQPRATP